MADRALPLVVVAALLFGAPIAAAQDASPAVALVVEAGRPLRVALDRRVAIRAVGQPITGTLVDPLYAYDRIVVPAGTIVRGTVAQLSPSPAAARVRAAMGGDFSPANTVTLAFETFELADGRRIPISSVSTSGAAHVALKMAATPKPPKSEEAAEAEGSGVVADARRQASAKAKDEIGRVKEQVDRAKQKAAHPRETFVQARQQAEQKARDTLAAIKAPGKMARLRDMAVARLPYHRQYLPQGSVYNVALKAPIEFGAVHVADAAGVGAPPQPDSVLSARLVTALDSRKSTRGAPVEAVLTEPVFSADHHLVLPEGSRLQGEVTFAKAAGRLHRDGQLRFLIESVAPPANDRSPMLASLFSVQVGDADVALDEEGGARGTSSKTRFIAPALALLSLRAAADHEHHHRFDNDDDDNPAVASQFAARTPGVNRAPAGIGGFFGWSLAGAALGQISRPVAVGVAAVGAARTMYSAFLGRGRDVVFPPGMPMQIQLAPGAVTP